MSTVASPGRAAATSNAALEGSSIRPDSSAVGPLNVLGGALDPCCTAPMTGYFRDGFCRTVDADHGRHVVCAVVTRAFLEFTHSRGNDLVTPRPGFPGLVPGDKWCLCALRWREALEAGVAPPVILSATHSTATRYVSLEQLQTHSLEPQAVAVTLMEMEAMNTE
jgi:uncharacterized protein